MTKTPDEIQAAVDGLVERTARIVDATLAPRALATAKQGIANPQSLSDDQLQLVCRTLIFQYAQLGID